MDIKVIIGSNYGDEGKGQTTDYQVSNLIKEGKVLNVLTNGGPQRGHTVIKEFGDERIVHVFHHFGSGTLAGAFNYFSEDFILNPGCFTQEYFDLKDALIDVYEDLPENYLPAYRNPKCRWSTPYDALANQFIEISSNHKKSSCGFGIWETIKRYRDSEYVKSFDDFMRSSCSEKVNYLLAIRNYYLNYFSKNNIELDKASSDLFCDKKIWVNFLNACEFFNENTNVVEDEKEFFNSFNSIVFENAQGLLLNDEGVDDPYKTPSCTGLKKVSQIIDRSFENASVEVCYITRPYLTRHGNGPLENCCKRDELGPNVEVDITNVKNRWQGSLRYAPLNTDELFSRIKEDFLSNINEKNKFYASLYVTHTKELDCNKLLKNSENFLSIKPI